MPKSQTPRDPDVSQLADIDFSLIQLALRDRGPMIEQILTALQYGSDEVRHLIFNQSDFIMECRVCRNLFRALPNFIAHKRIYCQRSFSESADFTSIDIPIEETVVIEPESVKNDEVTADATSPARDTLTTSSVSSTSSNMGNRETDITSTSNITITSEVNSAQLSHTGNTAIKERKMKSKKKGKSVAKDSCKINRDGDQILSDISSSISEVSAAASSHLEDFAEGCKNPHEMISTISEALPSDSMVNIISQIKDGTFKGNSVEYKLYSRLADKMASESVRKKEVTVKLQPIPGCQTAVTQSVVSPERSNENVTCMSLKSDRDAVCIDDVMTGESKTSEDLSEQMEDIKEDERDEIVHGDTLDTGSLVDVKVENLDDQSGQTEIRKNLFDNFSTLYPAAVPNVQDSINVRISPEKSQDELNKLSARDKLVSGMTDRPQESTVEPHSGIFQECSDTIASNESRDTGTDQFVSGLNQECASGAHKSPSCIEDTSQSSNTRHDTDTLDGTAQGSSQDPCVTETARRKKKKRKSVRIVPVKNTKMKNELMCNSNVDIDKLICRICEFRFSTFRTLCYHMKTKHTSKRRYFPCPVCSGEFVHIWGLTRHLRSVHSYTRNKIDKIKKKLYQLAFYRLVDGDGIEIPNYDKDSRQCSTHVSGSSSDSVTINSFVVSSPAANYTTNVPSMSHVTMSNLTQVKSLPSSHPNIGDKSDIFTENSSVKRRKIQHGMYSLLTRTNVLSEPTDEITSVEILPVNSNTKNLSNTSDVEVITGPVGANNVISFTKDYSKKVPLSNIISNPGSSLQNIDIRPVLEQNITKELSRGNLNVSLNSHEGSRSSATESADKIRKFSPSGYLKETKASEECNHETPLDNTNLTLLNSSSQISRDSDNKTSSNHGTNLKDTVGKVNEYESVNKVNPNNSDKPNDLVTQTTNDRHLTLLKKRSNILRYVKTYSRHQGKDIYQCSQCDALLNSFDSLKDHVIKNHYEVQSEDNEDEFWSGVDEDKRQSVSNYESVKKLIKFNQKPKTVEKIWCSKSAGKPMELVKSCRVYVMDLKDRSLGLKSQDSNEVYKFIDKANIQCRKCDEKFKSIANVRRHVIRHLGWMRFQCSQCSYVCYNKSECRVHMLRVHNVIDGKILDLHKGPSKVRTQKKQQALSARQMQMTLLSAMTESRKHKRKSSTSNTDVNKEISPEDKGQSKNRVSRLPASKSRLNIPFNISTRKSPRQFDITPYMPKPLNKELHYADEKATKDNDGHQMSDTYVNCN